MKILVPQRDIILVRMPLFCRVNPLQRPRIGAGKNVYQPKENQLKLLAEVKNYSRPVISEPVIVDSFIHFEPRTKTQELQSFPIDKSFGDEDNCRKALLDALVHNKILEDDRFVLGGANFKVMAEEDFVVVTVWSVKPELREIQL